MTESEVTGKNRQKWQTQMVTEKAETNTNVVRIKMRKWKRMRLAYLICKIFSHA